MKTTQIHRSIVLAGVSACSLGAFACGSDSNGVCDTASLEAALMSAPRGSEIAIGACTVSGHFRVPPGVTISGVSRSQSKLTSAASDPAPVIIAATEAGQRTTLRDLTLESDGSAAIIARGGGTFTLERVDVNATRGLGVAAEDLSSFAATEVLINGPVNMNNAGTIPFAVTATQSATWGLVLIRVAGAELDHVDVQGFAAAGIVLVDSDTGWTDGSASNNLALGVAVDGGRLRASRVEICDTMEPSNPTFSAGGVFFAGAIIETDTLTLCNSGNYGILQVGGTARHVGLNATNNDNSALWVQEATMLEVSGQVSDNDFAGVIAIDVDNVDIHDATMAGTKEAVRIFDTFGTKRVGDGIELVGAMQSATIRDVTLTNNERSGMVIDLAGGTIANVNILRVDATVTSTMQGGVVAQNGTAPAGWDNEVTRHGTSALDDAALAGSFEVVDTVGPCDRPREFGLRSTGVMGAIGF